MNISQDDKGQQKLTPMMMQYHQVKAKYQEEIVLFRMGDFYEMFHEDAINASKILNITLTSRNKNDSSPVPMCGFPFHAAKNYIEKLIEAGKKIAVCEQMGSSDGSTLLERVVHQVITPGMILDESLLTPKTNNFLVAIFSNTINPQIFSYGIASLDVSTGECKITTTSSEESCADEISRLEPNEIIITNDSSSLSMAKHISQRWPKITLTRFESEGLSLETSLDIIKKQFSTLEISDDIVQNFSDGLISLGLIVQYVTKNQPLHFHHVSKVISYKTVDFMIIDENSRNNLELFLPLRSHHNSNQNKGTLIDIIDHTQTAKGGRLIRQWLAYPSKNYSEIQRRLSLVEELLHFETLRIQTQQALSHLYDIERIYTKFVSMQAMPRDLLALLKTTEVFSQLKVLSQEYKKHSFISQLFELFEKIHSIDPLKNELARAVNEDPPPTWNEGGVFKKNYDSELDEWITLAFEGKERLAAIEQKEKTISGIPNLKIKYNKIFGYYIEISKSYLTRVPEYYIRKQTLTNGERFITPDLKEYEEKILVAEEKKVEREKILYQKLRDYILTFEKELLHNAKIISELDVFCSYAQLASESNYSRPQITQSPIIDIKNGRHPIVEKLVSETFVPNDCQMDTQNEMILLITGPNMAGKSTIMRQVALITILAQMGSYVPAESAVIGIVDQLFTRVGASDNLSRGQSTFMVEMIETAHILKNATKQSLILLDEIGRGTSTYDGISIAWAVAETIHEHIGARTFFATHYHELIELKRMYKKIKNMHIGVREWNGSIVFLRKFLPGSTNRSYGIQVAKLAGIPEKTICRAKDILKQLEQQANRDNFLGGIDSFSQQQISLFSAPSWAENIKQEILALSPDSTTPLEALNIIIRLKQELSSGKL